MSRKKKSQAEPYLVIPRRTIRSKELNSLSFQARWTYVVLCTEWKRNNGNKPFMFTYNQLIKIIHCNRHTLSKSLKELIEANFITKENHGGLLRNPNEYTMNELCLVIKQDSTPGSNN